MRSLEIIMLKRCQAFDGSIRKEVFAVEGFLSGLWITQCDVIS